MGSNDGTENYAVSERVTVFVDANESIELAVAAWEVHVIGSAYVSGSLIDLSK